MLTFRVVDLDESERDLVTRMRAGEESAFERFAEAYVPPLFRYATARLDRDRDLVPDVVQSVVTRAIDKLAGFRGEAPLLAWLCVCCRNEIAAIYRRRARRPAEVALDEPALEASAAARGDHADEPEARLLSHETRALVHVALERLPPHYAKALEGKYLEDLSVAEIARRLELTPKAAESVLSRARVAFRETFSTLGALREGDSRGSARIANGGAT